MKILLVLVVLLGMETAHAVPRILDADIVRGIKSVQNYVKNPEFETNIANVSDAGAGIISFSNVSPVDNTGSLVINSLLSGEIVKISTRAQQKKLEGQTCLAEFSYSGNATNYKAYVLNGVTNVSGDFPLSNAGAAAIHRLIPYPCQALNSTVDIAIESTAVTAGAIKLDSAFVGESEHALIPGYTAGSVLFSDGEKIAEDNTNLFFNNGTNILTVGNLLSLGTGEFAGTITGKTSLILEDPGAGTNTVTIQSGVPTASFTLTLPINDGAAGQLLSTDGSGVTSWINPSAGTVTLAVTTETANYTVLITDDLVICDTSSNNVTITLPTAVGNTGKQFYIKKISSAFRCFIDGDAAETIDEELIQVLNSKHTSVTIVSDGTNWLIL